MQRGQGNHTASEVLSGALHSAVLQHSLLRSCTSPHSNKESRFLSVQVRAARSLRSVSNNSLYSCLFLMFIFHFQPPTDMSLAAPDSFQCSHSPLHAAWALFPFTFSLHPSAADSKGSYQAWSSLSIDYSRLNCCAEPRQTPSVKYQPTAPTPSSLPRMPRMLFSNLLKKS